MTDGHKLVRDDVDRFTDFSPEKNEDGTIQIPAKQLDFFSHALRKETDSDMYNENALVLDVSVYCVFANRSDNVFCMLQKAALLQKLHPRQARHHPFLFLNNEFEY